jgi:hypothetical protein
VSITSRCVRQLQHRLCGLSALGRIRLERIAPVVRLAGAASRARPQQLTVVGSRYGTRLAGLLDELERKGRKCEWSWTWMWERRGARVHKWNWKWTPLVGQL